MTEQQRTLLEEGCAQLESRAGLIWGPEFIKEFAAAIRALLADLAQRTAERDEARREVCELLARSMKGPMEVAADRGWDCFKEVKP